MLCLGRCDAIVLYIHRFLFADFGKMQVINMKKIFLIYEWSAFGCKLSSTPIIGGP